MRSAGHATFAAALITVGVIGFVQNDFAPVWEPIAKDAPARDALVYLTASVSVGAGLGLVFERTSAIAARVLLVALTLWLIAFRVPPILHAPTVVGSYSGAAETAVMVAAALALAGFVRVARILYSLALIVFGLAHLAYVNDTASLVPAWLPAHVALAYFTGGAFLAAGAAVITGIFARLAAELSALQLGLFTLLVWVPIVAASGPKTAFQWSETILSAAITAGAWVIADSYRASAAKRN